MQSPLRPDGSEPTPDALQRPSITRDRTGSRSGSISLASPPPVDPEPAYIAASAASQIATSDHRSQTQGSFQENGDKSDPHTAVVLPASLALVNAFLDQLLFSFLASARSTSIASLRPAVSEVLKPRLAKDAINGADEELHEFLGGGDEEELSAFHNGLEPRGAWDLNLIWRRTRLRCMVYTRLGDMEEEDEESFVERERLEEATEGHHRRSRELGIVSPAAAIFLTSILEFVGEQALIVAGEAAYTRAEAKQVESAEDGTRRESMQRIVVEDADMEKIALNTTLGRLWRSWKKRVRSPSMLDARTKSRDFAPEEGFYSPASNPSSRHASFSELERMVSRPSVAEVTGGAPQSQTPPSDIDNSYTAKNAASRRSGVIGIQEYGPLVSSGGRRPSSMVLHPPRAEIMAQEPPASVLQRRRSSSLPALQPVSCVSPLSESFTTPKEAPGFFNNSFHSIHEQGKPLPEAPTANTPSVPATVATMYDGALLPDSEPNLKRTTESTKETDGMSKEEFDRQMLELVREMQSHATPDLANSERHLSSDGVDRISTAAASKEQIYNAHGATDGDQACSEKPAYQGCGRSTTEYWRGIKDASENIPSVPPQKLYKENQRGVQEIMQGESPRTASRGSFDSEYGRNWERQVPYFYHGPPASYSSHKTNATLRSGKDLATESPLLNPTIEAVPVPEAENGAPTLTPLRELVEAAHDTSDEASSLAPSHDASKSDYTSSDRFQNADVNRSRSFSSQALSQTRPASKLSDLRAQLPAVNTGTERAAVQRVIPSPVGAREPLTPVGRTSTSSNRDLRPIQTSSSGTSQVSQKLKGLVGRNSSDARRPETSRHSSEGSGSMTSDKRSLRTPNAEDAQRNFDQLIKSDETIQYTLTPQNMREMEAPDSPRWNHKRTDAADIADFLGKEGPEESESTRPVSSRSKVSLKGLNGLRANPTSHAKPPELTHPTQPTPQVISDQAKAPSRPTVSHSQTGVARDARTKDDSVRDFADFLRSTGPGPGAVSPQNPLPPIAEPRPLKALAAISPRPPSQQGAPKKITKPYPNTANQQRVNQQVEPAMIKRPPPKLQAREATLSSDSITDLADFIRQGPAERSEGRMRQPRTGEPPHSMADTSGIQMISNGKPKEADNSRVSVASTQVSSVPSKSVHSVSSRTGLLESSNAKSDSRQRTSESTERRPLRQDDPPNPVRKQRRVKDPYAIDTDSEDDNEYQAPPHRQEESIIDFLNSVTPPPSPPAVQSTFPHPPQPTKSPAPPKNHYPSMRERLTRNGVSSGNTKTRTSPPKRLTMGVPSVTRGKSATRQPASSTAPGKAPMPQSAPTMNRGRPEAARSVSPNYIKSQAPQLPPLDPRATSPHLISQIGTRYDSYRITRPTYAAHVDRDRKGAHRSPIQQQQPRGEREPGSGLGDLADFLKNSGPPTDVPALQRPVSPVKEKEKEGGFGRMFGRRKKSIH